jgi:hypothetical protein
MPVQAQAVMRVAEPLVSTLRQWARRKQVEGRLQVLQTKCRLLRLLLSAASEAIRLLVPAPWFRLNLLIEFATGEGSATAATSLEYQLSSEKEAAQEKKASSY